MLWPNHCMGQKYEYTVIDGENAPTKFFPPGSAHSTYMPVPNAGQRLSLQWDVSLLLSAFAGCGTDEDKIVRVLCSRSAAQIQTIGQMFKEQDPEQRDLVEVIESEISGDFKDAVMMLVKGQARLDAEVLYDSLMGIGTDEERLNEILTGRHPGQVEQIKCEYLLLGEDVTEQETLWDAVVSITHLQYHKQLAPV